MFKILYKYFILNRKLKLPGLGVLAIQRQPASLDYTRKAFTPPASRLVFTSVDTVPDQKFFSFISGEQKIEEADAAHRFRVFVQELKDSLQRDGVAHLPGLGSFTREMSGPVQFVPALTVPEFFPEVSIETGVSAIAQQRPTFVEPETKAVEALETTNEEAESVVAAEKGHWWVYAIILALLSVAAIVYYYTANGSLK